MNVDIRGYAVPKLSYAAFRAELLALYAPPMRSRNTWYKVRQVLDLLARAGVKSTADLTPAVVPRFLAALDGRSEPTVRGLLAYLRPICRYSHRMGYSRVDPFTIRADWYRAPDVGDDDPGAGDPVARHVPLDGLARLLDHLERGAGSWEGARIYALTATVAYTGMRRTEAITRAVADFDLDARIVRVRPRRRRLKTRAAAQPIGLPPELVPILASWLPRTRSTWAFPGTTGVGPWLGGQLKRRALDALHQAGEAVGIGPVNFLQLRHSWATHAEVRGLGELAVQRQLRHTTRRTQQHYRHADAANLAAAVERFSLRPPLAEVG